MPLPMGLARFNRVVTNRIGRRVAPLFPGFIVLQHRGRRSGRRYETPVNAFRDGDRIVIALTYGSKADWVRNVLAAGGCEGVQRRRPVRLSDPHLIDTDVGMAAMPRLVRWVLRNVANADEFLAATIEDGSPRR